MANKKSQTIMVSDNTGMMLVFIYFVTFLVSAIVLYLANLLFPRNIVLGTMTIPPLWAIFHSMGKLALITTLAVPFLTAYEKGKQPNPMVWMGAYLVINFISIWGISRFPEQFGLGVSSWIAVAVLAFVINFVQGMAMMFIGKKNNN